MKSMSWILGKYKNHHSIILRGISQSKFSTFQSKEVISVDYVVIGGGCVGLAVANSIVEKLRNQKDSKYLLASTNNNGPCNAKGLGNNDCKLLVLEKNHIYGEEISSRNSEVIHGGLYYPISSLKTKLCLEGNRLIYNVCKKFDIPHVKCGKWITAQSDYELDQLKINIIDKFKATTDAGDHFGDHGCIKNLRLLSKKEMNDKEPNLKAKYAIESPETGIIDSFQLMAFLAYQIERDDIGMIATRTRVTGIHVEQNGNEGAYLLSTNHSDFIIRAKNVINCAGLYSDQISQMVLSNFCHYVPQFPELYKIYLCKGQYFSYLSGQTIFSRLIYPVPDKNITSLGIHCTIDLTGRLRFGPDVKYMDPSKGDVNSESVNDYNLDFTVNENDREKFYKSIQTYFPNVDINRLQPEYAGYRPKLQKPGGAFRDFMIERLDELDQRLPSTFVNCIGIESPGLTSCLAIGEYVVSKKLAIV